MGGADGVGCSIFFFSSRRRHTRSGRVTGVQTCALPIYSNPSITVRHIAECKSGLIHHLSLFWLFLAKTRATKH